LNHPGVAKVSCSDCQKRAYDLETGQPKTYPAGPTGELRFYDQNHVPPCRTGWTCPKVSPEQEHEHVLSNKNWRIVTLYHQAKAAGAAVLGDVDPLLAELLAACERAYGDFERREDHSQHERLMATLARRIIV
jgi:hypothetical protein